MAKPKSEDKRNAILDAATRVIAAQGLGASTALIAQEAGVATGSLFTYFPTKAALYDALYLELRGRMAASAMGLPARAGLRTQLLHGWTGWMDWALANPDMRSALRQLGSSDEITPVTIAAGHKAMAGVAELLERSRANGPLRHAPLGLVIAILNALAEATMEFIAHDPARAKEHSKVGFEALWRVVA